MLTIYQKNNPNFAVNLWPTHDIPEGFIQESRSYIFQLIDIEPDLRTELFINDIPLTGIKPPDRSTLLWSWNPGFHSGKIEVTLLRPKTKPYSFEIVTDPDLEKISHTEYNKMVQDIIKDSLDIFSFSGFRKGLGKTAKSRQIPYARLEYFRSKAAQIEQAILEISKSPRRILRHKTQTKPYYKVKRVTGQEIHKSMRAGKWTIASNTKLLLPNSLNQRVPFYIKQNVRESGFDIKEHREIKNCLISWSHWLIAACTLIELHASNQDETGNQSKKAWAKRLRAISQKFIKLAELPFLRDIQYSNEKPRLSPLYKCVPAYRQFFGLYHDINLGLANVFGEYLDIPMNRTFELYEYWCLIKIVRILAKKFNTTVDNPSDLFSYSKQRGILKFSHPLKPVKLNNGITISYQKRFGEFWKEKSNIGTYSRPMIPDITITYSSNNCSSWTIILDPKYRIKSNLNSAIDSIHMYRDAILKKCDDGSFTKAIDGAYLISPYNPVLKTTDWMSTPMPERLFCLEYREKFNFGALTLHPGMQPSDIQASIESIIPVPDSK